METASFETKLGWITVKKNRGNVCSLSFGKTNKTIDFGDVIGEQPRMGMLLRYLGKAFSE